MLEKVRGAVTERHEEADARANYSIEALEPALRNVQAYVQLPLLYEHWYVAGTSDEFSRKLVAKTLLNRSIVFYRKESGELVALQNRCAHRSYPLSESFLEGDTIRCGYHGIRYNPDGSILKVPCQDRVPTLGVRSYAIHEMGPLVWIWMGDGPADESKMPDMTPYTSSDWTFCVGTLPMPGNYLLMQENLADLSHLPYLHATTFGVPESWGSKTTEMTIDEERLTVDFYRESTEWEQAKTFFPPYFNYEGRNLLDRAGGRYETPAFFRGWDLLKIKDSAPGERDEFRVYFDHFLTPETGSSTHYYYGVARDHALEDSALTEGVRQIMARAFAQDSEAVGHMQKLLDTDRHDFKELIIAGDRTAVASRRMILRLVEREYGPQSKNRHSQHR
ncbi:MAG TPA: aromatic ring-hydroxylating dioxygenase subunit alpha [Vicinamibacterales bacterium]|nr:aromatic ring-hydroxylating dioxygenase subunit alpha [Vicinamibacterales bacterium]